MIAGFPGETTDDFAANDAYLPGSPLSHLHVFPYSDRPGTEASGMPGGVAAPVIRERSVRLREIGASLARRFREAQVGTLRPGLTLEDGTLVLTDNYLKVRVPPGCARNERVVVRIAEAGGSVQGSILHALRGVTDWAIPPAGPPSSTPSIPASCAPGAFVRAESVMS
jgi:threonylcarbamoyladenosine tRNA methylthiotransferase MtaB